jgi:hypothetical protein
LRRWLRRAFQGSRRIKQRATFAIQWKGSGRVFQLERAETLSWPYLQISPIIPDLFFNDAGALSNQAQTFYRLRQW